MFMDESPGLFPGIQLRVCLSEKGSDFQFGSQLAAEKLGPFAGVRRLSY
jgi:hypothetical protein